MLTVVMNSDVRDNRLAVSVNFDALQVPRVSLEIICAIEFVIVMMVVMKKVVATVASVMILLLVVMARFAPGCVMVSLSVMMGLMNGIALLEIFQV